MNLVLILGNKIKFTILGDVPFPEANDNEKCIERISSFYDHIEKAEKPVVSIGGDHSITGGILQSLAKKNSKLTKGKKSIALYTLMLIQIVMKS